MDRIIIGCATIVMAMSWAMAQDAPAPGLKRIGIAEIKINPTLKEVVAASGKALSLGRVTEAMDGQLIDRLHSTRKFQIVGRSDVDRLFTEQGFSSKPNQVKSLDYLLVLTVDDFQDRREVVKFGAIGQAVEIRTVKFSGVGKLYDAATGDILEITNIQHVEELRGEQDLKAKADALQSDEALIIAARNMADRAANRVIDVIFPAKVIANSEGLLTINRGDGTGIAVGQVWTLCKVGKPLRDPDTGEILGVEETPYGTVQIVSVLPKFSTGKMVGQTGAAVEVGAILRPPQPIPVPGGAGQEAVKR